MSAEEWFKNLNWAMQRRAMEALLEGPGPAWSQALEYFPPPFREGRQWVFPIKGEVDRMTPGQERAFAVEVIKYLGPDPVLKRPGREVWTDIKLKAAGK